jgi:TrpR-related protein YerC/YecD
MGCLTSELYSGKVHHMSTDTTNIWKSELPQQLAGVLVAIDDKDTMQNFLRDVMTEKEIIEISARLEAARMLSDGERYIEITKKTKLSSRTVARISDWLKNGCNGYKAALKLVDKQRSHISPARAE